MAKKSKPTKPRPLDDPPPDRPPKGTIYAEDEVRDMGNGFIMVASGPSVMIIHKSHPLLAT